MQNQYGDAIDPETIEAARRGDARSLDLLLRAVWPDAFRVAFSIVRSATGAEDAAQEACAAVVRSIERLRSPEAFGVWFYRIVVREALRIDRRTPRAEPLDEMLPSSENSFYGSVERLDVLRALGKLTAAQRAAVTLRYYADLNSREIAGVLGIPEGTVRFHLASARRLLERHLGARYGDATFGEPRHAS